MSPQLNVPRLREAARAKGDRTDYAIHKTTGLALATISRLVNGHSQPSIYSLDRFKQHYDISLEELLSADEPTTGAVA